MEIFTLKHNRKTVFSTTCPYCNGTFSNYSLKKHTNKCFLNPSIAKKIIDYLDLCLQDINLMKKKSYIIYSKIHDLPNTSNLLSIIPNSTYWHSFFPFIILNYYEYAFLKDIEKYDILIKICTLNTMGTSFEVYKKSFDKYIKENNVDISENYLELFYAVIKIAYKDFYSPNDIDEDGNIIDKIEAYQFLKELYPSLLKI